MTLIAKINDHRGEQLLWTSLEGGGLNWRDEEFIPFKWDHRQVYKGGNSAQGKPELVTQKGVMNSLYSSPILGKKDSQVNESTKMKGSFQIESGRALEDEKSENEGRKKVKGWIVDASATTATLLPLLWAQVCPKLRSSFFFAVNIERPQCCFLAEDRDSVRRSETERSLARKYEHFSERCCRKATGDIDFFHK